MRQTLQLATLLVVTSSTSLGAEIVAHRGASRDAPENTLPAIRLAWERDADAVEIDIQQTKDGRIVAIHDANTKRVAGRDVLVSEQTLEEIQQLDAGGWLGEKWRGTRIPTLAEVLETLPEAKTLVIEIKCPATALPELERVLDASGKRAQVMIIAFDYDTSVAAKQLLPEIPNYWLFNFTSESRVRYGVKSNDDLIALSLKGGLDGLDVKFNGPFDKPFVDNLHAQGMKLYVYTVNSPKDAQRVANMGVVGITTDGPGFLREKLSVP